MARDPIKLAQDLIRCPSVTPADAGALDVLQTALEGLGFACHRLPFSEAGTPDVDNLYARLGTAAPNFCFAGHTDVVPVGALDDWKADPFAGVIEDGWLIGRGAADMKGSIACFVAAVAAYLDAHGAPKGSISLLITGDEEGPAINGTPKMLEWLKTQGEVLDHCLVGEPTNREVLGDMAKIGRRASLNARIEVTGVQGHVAYPDRARNPVPVLVDILSKLLARKLDQGTDHFQPSNLEVTDLEVGNPATNVIPAKASARLNIRFNDLHKAGDLRDWISQVAGTDATVTFMGHGDAFVTAPGPFTDIIAGSIEAVLGRAPELSTSGGTSDARFIKDHCPVAEFGLVGKTMHQVDERVAVADMEALTRIYGEVLTRYFD